MGKLEDLKDMLQKSCKGMHISALCDSNIATSKENLPTPSHDLNRIISGSLYKGVPEKAFTLIVGPEASFKSSMMCLCAAEAQRRGYTPVIIDTEGAWTDTFVERWGMDPKGILYIYSPMVDEISVALGQLINEGAKKLCLIIDSIGGMESTKLLIDAGKGDIKADQGGVQRNIKRMLKLVLYICKGHDSIAFASGHYYGNTTGYGDAEQIGGGKFAKLAPDIIITLKKSKMFDKDKNVIGNSITAITMKNRFYPPFAEATIDINYKNGINKNAGLVSIAQNAGLITTSGSWFTNVVTGERVQGEANAEKCINDALLKKLDEYIANTGYSTTNVEIAAVEEDEKDIDPSIVIKEVAENFETHVVFKKGKLSLGKKDKGE